MRYFSFPSLNFFLESLVWVNMQLAWCLYHGVYFTSPSSKEVLRTRKFWQNHCWSQVEKRGVKRAVDPFKWIQTSNSGPNGLMYQVSKITTSRVCSWQSLSGLTKIYTSKFYVIGWATAGNFPSKRQENLICNQLEPVQIYIWWIYSAIFRTS